MQVSVILHTQESFVYKTAHTQNNAQLFGEFLHSQDKNSIKEQEAQKESKQQLQDILDLKGSFMAFVGVAQAAMLESEKIYGSIDNGFDILRQWYKESDSKKIEKILESSISALETYPNVGGYLNEFGNPSPIPQHIFEAEKSEAIDILSEILQNIKT